MLIKFVEKTHQYVTEEGRELTSVSKFTEQFKEKVDWKAIAKKVAARETKNGNPTTTEQVMTKWERKRNISAEIGTKYHYIREEELISQKSPEFYNVPCETKQCLFDGEYKYSIPIQELKNNMVYPELMIYDLEHGICGQSDKVIVVKNRINIWDYKTDEELKHKAYSSQWVDPKKLTGPLSHLDECNLNLYSIKMSLYMYMLWKANKGRFLPGDLIIEHVHLKRNPEDDNIPMLDEAGNPIVLKIEQVKLPYRKKEVMDMLATLKK